MMIGLRPMRSDSEPKTTKKPVPINSEMATMMLADCASTLRMFCRKNSA